MTARHVRVCALRRQASCFDHGEPPCHSRCRPAAGNGGGRSEAGRRRSPPRCATLGVEAALAASTAHWGMRDMAWKPAHRCPEPGWTPARRPVPARRAVRGGPSGPGARGGQRSHARCIAARCSGGLSPRAVGWPSSSRVTPAGLRPDRPGSRPGPRRMHPFRGLSAATPSSAGWRRRDSPG